MKKMMMITSLFFLSLSLFAQTPVQNTSFTPNAAAEDGIQWTATSIDLGDVTKDIPAKAQFELQNTGDTPLILKKVKASCSCTTSGYTKEPILPGESTTITASYNAKKLGTFSKTVKVTTNRSDQPIVLRLKGMVTEKVPAKVLAKDQ